MTRGTWNNDFFVFCTPIFTLRHFSSQSNISVDRFLSWPCPGQEGFLILVKILLDFAKGTILPFFSSMRTITKNEWDINVFVDKNSSILQMLKSLRPCLLNEMHKTIRANFYQWSSYCKGWHLFVAMHNIFMQALQLDKLYLPAGIICLGTIFKNFSTTAQDLYSSRGPVEFWSCAVVIIEPALIICNYCTVLTLESLWRFLL